MQRMNRTVRSPPKQAYQPTGIFASPSNIHPLCSTNVDTCSFVLHMTELIQVLIWVLHSKAEHTLPAGKTQVRTLHSGLPAIALL
jgi:hypothetical protein